MQPCAMRVLDRERVHDAGVHAARALDGKTSVDQQRRRGRRFQRAQQLVARAQRLRLEQPPGGGAHLQRRDEQPGPRRQHRVDVQALVPHDRALKQPFEVQDLPEPPRVDDAAAVHVLVVDADAQARLPRHEVAGVHHARGRAVDVIEDVRQAQVFQRDHAARRADPAQRARPRRPGPACARRGTDRPPETAPPGPGWRQSRPPRSHRAGPTQSVGMQIENVTRSAVATPAGCKSRYSSQ